MSVCVGSAWKILPGTACDSPPPRCCYADSMQQFQIVTAPAPALFVTSSTRNGQGMAWQGRHPPVGPAGRAARAATMGVGEGRAR
jgi:hypothetical protein